jgi:hypothetical protein
MIRGMRRDGPLDSIASVLTGLAHRLGLESKLLETRLRRQWSEVVGQHIAAHTSPDQIRFKKLYVYVRHSVWLQQLTYLKPDLLKKINAAAGEMLVSDLILRIGDFGADSQKAEQCASEPAARVEPPPAVKADAAHHAQAVRDPDLRNHFAAVMAQALTRPMRARGTPQSSL